MIVSASPADYPKLGLVHNARLLLDLLPSCGNFWVRLQGDVIILSWATRIS